MQFSVNRKNKRRAALLYRFAVKRNEDFSGQTVWYILRMFLFAGPLSGFAFFGDEFPGLIKRLESCLLFMQA